MESRDKKQTVEKKQSNFLLQFLHFFHSTTSTANNNSRVIENNLPLTPPKIDESLNKTSLTDLYADVILINDPLGLHANQAKRPAHVLLEMIIKQLNKMKPHFPQLDGELKKQFISLHELYHQLRDLVILEENERQAYSAKQELIIKRDEYFDAYSKKSTKHKESISQYDIFKNKLHLEMQETGKTIKLITSETEMKNLQSFSLAQLLYQELSEHILQVTSQLKNLSYLSTFFYRGKQTKINLENRKKQLEDQLTLLSTNTGALREKMLMRLKEEQDAKLEIMQELIKHQPKLDKSDYEQWLKIDNKIRLDEADYYQQISDNLMMCFLRFSYMLDKITNLTAQGHEKIHEPSKSELAKGFNQKSEAFKLFYEVTTDSKSIINEQLKDFYCKHSGRFYFAYYLNVLRDTKFDLERENILEGRASLEVVRGLLPNFQPGFSFVLNRKN